ncbi:MAG TPA: hypothetical protein VLF18_08955 [Tahibacter sp.]|uniref:hypothetical protein n=1 Tax=Tahibacter sp. TaxID=2056211 RepID=UPI002CB590BA|nr:hypothetical protein [Tahibacter sp.]HSX60314.1 hypothetical protein [Tahibacter sp.]
MLRQLLAVSLALAGSCAFAEGRLPAELPPAEESAALAAAASTGATIYRHDQAASVATDAARAVRKFKKDKRVKGWVTEQRGDAIVVTFIDSTPAALYRVPVTQGVAGEVEIAEAPAPLSAFESGAASARSSALASTFQPCATTYNPVVLPGSNASEDWIVYLLPGTTKNTLVPLGGTYRFSIKDNQVASQRGFTRTCVALETGPNVEALMVTHLLDPVPTEVHVFWSLWARKPIYISTPPGGTLWSIDGDKIRLVERKAATS